MRHHADKMYLMNGATAYVASIILHVLFIGLFIISEGGWFKPSEPVDNSAMIIDLVSAPEVSSESSIAKNLVRTVADSSPKMKIDKEYKPNINGDTNLLSKDNKIYTTPSDKGETGESIDIPDKNNTATEDAEEDIKADIKEGDKGAPDPAVDKPDNAPEIKQIEATEERAPEAVPKVLPIQPSMKPKIAPVLAESKVSAAPKPKPRQDNKKYEQVLQTVKQYKHEGAVTKENISESSKNATESISDYDQKLSEHLMQYIYSKLVQCWDVPVSAAESSVKVELETRLNHLGHVTEVKILHRIYGDPIYDAVESSAVRAIKACSPLAGLPGEKYYLWNRINLVFDPRKLRAYQ